MSDSRKLRIVVDDAIVDAEESFRPLCRTGGFVQAPGNAIDRSMVKDADALIVRSVTRVDAELIEGSRIQFVGTATSGQDHLDLKALRSLKVTVAHARGCNAEAVAQWVLASFLNAHLKNPMRWTGPFGIVGFGHVGRRLYRHLHALGLSTLLCDPPLLHNIQQQNEHYPKLESLFRDFDELCKLCTTISFHVPLTEEGPHPTKHMIQSWAPGFPAIINTARGELLSAQAVSEAPKGNHAQLILDVWPNEPNLIAEHLAADGPVLQASPHIAGYSLDAKRRATRMVAEALVRHFAPSTSQKTKMSEEESVLLSLDSLESALTTTPQPSEVSPDQLAKIRDELLNNVQLTHDDQNTRSLAPLEPTLRATRFEQLRRGYALRSELEIKRDRLRPKIQ